MSCEYNSNARQSLSSLSAATAYPDALASTSSLSFPRAGTESDTERNDPDAQDSVEPETGPAQTLTQSTRRASTVHDLDSSTDTSATHAITHIASDSKSLQMTVGRELEVVRIPHRDSIPPQATAEAIILEDVTAGLDESRVEEGLYVIVPQGDRAGLESAGLQTPSTTRPDTPPPPYSQAGYIP